MLNFCSLYSGSTGNCLLVQTETTNILVDAGVSAKKIDEALSSINVDINSINAIIVTHEHSDHTKSIGTMSKKYNIPVYANLETWNAMPNEKNKILECNIKSFNLYNKFCIGDIEIYPFSIPHDAANPCGFNLYHDSNKISIATDIGHMNDEILSALKESSFVLLESNYDPEILKCCSYPYSLKTRIASPIGHLPNAIAGETIANLAKNGLKKVMLGHLSKENNFPELAYQTVVEQLSSRNIDIHSLEISVASRIEPSSLIHIA